MLLDKTFRMDTWNFHGFVVCVCLCVLESVCVYFRIAEHVTGHFSQSCGDGTDRHFVVSWLMNVLDSNPRMAHKSVFLLNFKYKNKKKNWRWIYGYVYCVSYSWLIPQELKRMTDKQKCTHLPCVLCIRLHLPSSLSIYLVLSVLCPSKPLSVSPASSLSCSMPLLRWDWYNIFQPQLTPSLLTNSNCFCTWELGAGAGKTEWGGGEGLGVAGGRV